MKRLILILLLCASQAYGGALLSAAHRRNASSFTPLSIAGCQLWLDASQLTGLSNNDPLSTWTDFSTHSRNATQSGGSRPTYKTNVQNGLPAIFFVAGTGSSGQYMSGSLTLSQPMTVFVVLQHTGSFTYQFVFDGSTNRVALARLTPTDNQYDLFAGSDGIVSHTDDTSWHYIGAVVNGSSSLLSIDGSVTSSLTSGSNSLGSTYFVGTVGTSPGTDGMDGYIAEFIIYDTALSSGDRVLVQNYLKAKYGL